MVKEIHLNKRFVVQIGQKISIVETNEVAYFYTDSRITFMMTHRGKRYPIDYSLNQLEEFSNPGKFFRINRQFIISMEAIKEMWKHPKARIKLTLEPLADRETIVSTEKTPLFKKWLVG